MSNPGDLDTSFGTNGYVSSDFSGFTDQANSVLVQSDGKIIVGGIMVPGQGQGYNFALARYNANGSLDTTFGTGGKVITDFGGNSNDNCNSISLQSDGKIIAGGTRYINSSGTLSDFALARYNTDGSLDTSFGTNGYVITDFSGNDDTISSIAIQSDDKIVAGGKVNISGAGNVGNNFGLARYNTNGSLDTSFGTNGKVYTDFSGNSDIAYSVAIQSDGKIIAGGTVNIPGTGNGGNNFGLARYNTDGTLDTSFGTGGKVYTDFSGNSDIAYSVKLQSDNKIILAGYTTTLGSGNGSDNFGLARYNTDGTLDTSFGTGGKVYTDFSGNSYDYAYSMAIQPDNNKIILVGYIEFRNSPKSNFGIIRYSANGFLDKSFGNDGKAYTDFSGNTYSSAQAVAIQNDGKIVVVGRSLIGNQNNFGIIRYIGGEKIVVPICFPAGTPVVTDQGIIAIDKINNKINTIRGKKIVAITKTTTLEDKIVCIEKDALAHSIPSQKTLISRNHKLLYNKQMIKAKNLIGQVDGVYNKKYNGEVLYNVLLETHEKMLVNNLIVETLDPKNIVAQLYNGTLSVEERNNAIININQCANEYKKQYGKLK